MTGFWLVAIAVLAIALETFVYFRNPRRSVVRSVNGDGPAVVVGLLWWACAVGVSWVNDGDPLGGAVYGLMGAAIIGSLVAMVRRGISRRRRSHTTS
ncbi:hypothetical protein [Streptomyces sp. ODS28]|uniref:hypothetical protein n=1 Tax=Streptomyces sp. ODS28 TaxID=3136688 RepID=UPI0031E6C0E7